MHAVVVLPTYNERDTILELIRDILSLDTHLSILVVDDNSEDGTSQIVSGMLKDEPRLELIVRLKGRGRGLAGAAGFQMAMSRGADYIIEMDADFSHHPRFIPRLLEAMGQADIAIGSRFIPGAAVSGRRPWRTMLSWASNMLIRQVLGLKVRDCTSGFRCFRKEALASLELDRFICEGPSIVEEILYLSHRKGMKIREVPIVFYERSKGRSKLTLKKLFFVLRDILWIRIRYA